MPLTKRSRARALALQALCVFETVGDTFAGELDGFLRDRANYRDLGWKRPLPSELLTLARTLALGTWQERPRCDELLERTATGWSLERMQVVDRNILRLGLYELLQRPETPYQVVINEAVELARVFGGADSPAFVNGVLDGIRRQLMTGK